MVGELNTFGFKPDTFPTRIYFNAALQVTQVASPLTLYTVPAGKRLYIAGVNQTANCTLEPVASDIQMLFAGIPSKNVAVLTANQVFSWQQFVAGSIQEYTLLEAGEAITIRNQLALGDCTIQLQIVGYLVNI